jgi:hypothetical protein
VPLWQRMSYIVQGVTAGTTRLTERKKEWTRREIAQAPADPFTQRGYAATTVNDIVPAVQAEVAEAFAPGWNDRAQVKWFFMLPSETPPLPGRWLEERDRESRDPAATPLLPGGAQ